MKMTAKRWALLMTAIDAHKRYLREQAKAAEAKGLAQLAHDLRADAKALESAKEDLRERYQRDY